MTTDVVPVAPFASESARCFEVNIPLDVLVANRYFAYPCVKSGGLRFSADPLA